MDPSTPLKGLPLAVLDTETTGIDPETDHVVEVAVVHTTLSPDATPRVVLSHRVRPPIPIPGAASRVHGITDGDVADCPTWEEVLPEVVGACEGRVPLAHSAPFEAAFIPEIPGPWLCSRVVGQMVDRKQWKKHLGGIARRRGIRYPAHGATADAWVCAALYRDLLWDGMRLDDRRQIPKLRTLGQVLDWQRDAALGDERYAAKRYEEARAAEPPRFDWHRLLGVELPTVDLTHPTRTCRTCGGPVIWDVSATGDLSVLNPDDTPHTCRGAAWPPPTSWTPSGARPGPSGRPWCGW